MSSSQTTSTTKEQGSLLQRLNIFLDEHVLPYPVRFLTNRIIILATLALLIPLVFFTSNQAFVNGPEQPPERDLSRGQQHRAALRNTCRSAR